MKNLQQHKSKSFSPNINNDSNILVLGAMPGIKSLDEQQYYAPSQNRFWKLMGKICNEDNLQNLDYEKKLKVLLANRIALLDVIQTCNIAVSLDSNIQNEKPNKIVQLLKEFPNIYTICLNGNKSYTAFKKTFSRIVETISMLQTSIHKSRQCEI